MSIIKKIFSTKGLFLNSFDWGVLILRMIPSFFLFYNHGFKKLENGISSWERLGELAMPIIGIEFGFVFFGFFAALSESLFAISVMVGFNTRISSFLILFTMFMAGTYHLVGGESGESAYIYFVIYLVIFILGPGKLSIDSRLFKENKRSGF